MKDIDIYPLTIIKSRYNGIYSGGIYLAFNLHHQDVPSEATGGDMECDEFWREYSRPVGKGSKPGEAIYNLLRKLS